jgi:hypothetical protein
MCLTSLRRWAISRPPPARPGFTRPIFFRKGALSPRCDRRANGSELKTNRCRRYSIPTEEAQIRALLVQGFGVSDLRLRELESTDIEGTGRVAVNATLTSEKRREIALEYIVGRLSLEPSVTAARWRAVNTIV